MSTLCLFASLLEHCQCFPREDVCLIFALESASRNTVPRKIFPNTLPRANIRHTSSRGKHWQCSSNDANRHNVDICRQAKCQHIFTNQSKVGILHPQAISCISQCTSPLGSVRIQYSFLNLKHCKRVGKELSGNPVFWNLTVQNALGYLPLDSSCQSSKGGNKYTFVEPWLRDSHSRVKLV